jgi:hypothetical protein
VAEGRQFPLFHCRFLDNDIGLAVIKTEGCLTIELAISRTSRGFLLEISAGDRRGQVVSQFGVVATSSFRHMSAESRPYLRPRRDWRAEHLCTGAKNKG